METAERSKEEDETATEIPLELITEILSRVPGKELTRFKLVSKQWLSLIQNLVITHLHLRQSEERNPRKLIKMIRVEEKPPFSIHTMIYSIDKKGTASPIHPPFRLGFAFSAFCNGLLCYLSLASDVQVSNPVTRETITLPRSSLLQNIPMSDFLRPMIAIGFDSRLKVYKIVAWDQDNDSQGEVFTLGTTSWRKITGPSLRAGITYYFCGEHVYVDGVSYWRPQLCSEGITDILLFDYAEEKFGTVEGPNDIKYNERCWLCESSGHLCLTVKQEKNSRKEKKQALLMWILNKHEDGRQEWSSQPRNFLSKTVKKIKSNIVSIGNGEIMTDRIKGFALNSYNEQGQVVNTIKPEKLDGLKYCWFDQFHIGSLVRLT